MSNLNWSTYQKNIFTDIKEGKGHTIINALAGSAKTTTLIQALHYIDPKLSTLMVAFSKSIAEELKDRAPKHIQCSTLHALGLKCLGKAFPGIRIDEEKVNNILLRMHDSKKELKRIHGALRKTVSLAKGCLGKTTKQIDDIIDDFEIDWDDEICNRNDFIEKVLFILSVCKKNTNIIDFDDMVWLPNTLGVDIPRFDRILVDEAQDLNAAQRALIMKMIKEKGGRLIVAGDSNQAIFGWAGADSQSISNFQTATSAKILPLSISYRCPISVVKEAQKLVPQIEWAPNAVEGKVGWSTQENMLSMAKAGCFILSRTNAPLVHLALNFIKRHIPANIQGRNIGEGLIALTKKTKSKKIDLMLKALDKWEKKEVKRLEEKEKDSSLVKDRAECLRALSSSCKDTEEVRAKISSLFVDKSSSQTITLSTVHRAKGLERDMVYMLINTFSESDDEEKACKYVAITRAKKTLYFVKYDKEKMI